MRFVHRCRGGGGLQRVEGQHPVRRAGRQAAAAQQHRHVGRHRPGDGAREGFAVGGVDQPRRQQRHGMGHARGRGVEQRVRRRHRCHRHAHVQRRQAQQRVLEVVARQDDQGPLGREAQVEQGLPAPRRSAARIPRG
jgi:hypothetical protein